jgi:hypothetical protein
VQPRLIELDPVDAERDHRVHVVVLTDYHGRVVGHVFVDGQRLAEFSADSVADRTELWSIELVRLGTSAERQAAITVAQQVGAITEDQAATFAWAAGQEPLESMVFDDIGENSDQHALLTWAADVVVKIRAAL